MVVVGIESSHDDDGNNDQVDGGNNAGLREKTRRGRGDKESVKRW